VKVLVIVACVLLLVGSALTVRAVYLHAKAELAGFLIRRSWEYGSPSGQFRPPWPWADTRPVARLEIPSLHYDEIVLEGATPRTLAFGPARLLSSPEPGEPGNIVVAGHRTSWFRSLETIQRNDLIQLQWFDLRRKELLQRDYSVTSIAIVSPEAATPLLAPTEHDALTLITCYPFGASPVSPRRFVVRASPLGPSRAASPVQRPNNAFARFSRGYEQTAFGAVN
jgi:sortase A